MQLYRPNNKGAQLIGSRQQHAIFPRKDDDDFNSVSEIAADPGSSSQGSSANKSNHDLLSFRLSDFQLKQPVPTFISRTETQLEVEKYQAVPHYPMKDDLLVR